MYEKSILQSIKKMLGISQEDTHFDTDIIIHINSYLMILNQLGVGPPDGFTITDKSSDWSQFLNNSKKLELAKTFIYLNVKLVFDPPSSTAVIESMKEQIKEYAWRLQVAVDPEEEEIQNGK